MVHRTTKSFASLQRDYRFFQQHSNELQTVSRAMGVAVRGRSSPGYLLDFGSADGHFLAETLATAGVASDAWHITVLDPVEAYRTEAVSRLTPWSRSAVTSWQALPCSPVAQFDCVIANHVLYYVPDLVATLDTLWASTVSGGAIYITMGHDLRNALVECWIAMFRAIAAPLPYHLSSNVQQELARRGWNHNVSQLSSQLTFDDCPDHRQAIGHFLFGERFSSVDTHALNVFFDRYSEGGVVKMPLVDVLYRVDKP